MIKENTFTKDIFFEKEARGFSAVSKKKKLIRKEKVESTELSSKNFGASVGSSQNVVGDDFRYRGDVEVTTKISAETIVSYFETLPYLMPTMDIVLSEKLEKWNPKGKDFRAMAKKCVFMLKWEVEDLIKDLKEWKTA